MNPPPRRVEQFLGPGEFLFGGSDTRIITVLGSCVAITLWHPKRRIGGICHYLLPGRPGVPGQTLDAKYADDAVRLLLNEVATARTSPGEYQAKAFGGSSMFPSQTRSPEAQVGYQNVSAAHQIISRYSLRCTATDLGGIGHRNLIFDIGDGRVWVRRDLPGSDSHPGNGGGRA